MGDIIRKRKNGKDLGWYIRWVDTDGKRRQRASHQPTYALAKRMLLEIEARIARGQVGLVEREQEQPPLTVRELLEKWLAEFASPRIKDLQRYRAGSRTSLRRLLPYIGNIELAALTRLHIEKARDAVARCYRPNTVRATLRPLGTCLSWSVRHGLLKENLVRGLELPRPERAVECLEAAEATRLLIESQKRARSTNKPSAWSRAVAIALALRMGLRRGEIFGLRWQDINLDAGRLTVARSYTLLPKSGKLRHLPLPATMVSMLREWREVCPQTTERLVCPVFYARQWGMSSNRTKHGLPELLRAASCKPLARGWHSLRHTFASQFIMQGGNILTLQKLLGHADIAMTLIYSHLAPDFLAGEMERLRY